MFVIDNVPVKIRTCTHRNSSYRDTPILWTSAQESALKMVGRSATQATVVHSSTTNLLLLHIARTISAEEHTLSGQSSDYNGGVPQHPLVPQRSRGSIRSPKALRSARRAFYCTHHPSNGSLGGVRWQECGISPCIREAPSQLTCMSALLAGMRLYEDVPS